MLVPKDGGHDHARIPYYRAHIVCFLTVTVFHWFITVIALSFDARRACRAVMPSRFLLTPLLAVLVSKNGGCNDVCANYLVE